MLSLRVNSVTTKQEDRPMARVEGSGTDSSDFIDSVGEVMIATTLLAKAAPDVQACRWQDPFESGPRD
jgi:hypothetical protein